MGITDRDDYGIRSASEARLLRQRLEVIHARQKLESALGGQSVLDFHDGTLLYFGPRTPDGKGIVGNFFLRPHEQSHAPNSVQELLDRLGIYNVNPESTMVKAQIDDTDGFSLMFSAKPVTPHQLGIQFHATRPTEIITLVGNARMYVNYHNSTMNGYSSLYEQGVMDAVGLYSLPLLGERRNIQHPYVANVMKDAAEWTANLLNIRKKNPS